jgi:hypothetical protein
VIQASAAPGSVAHHPGSPGRPDSGDLESLLHSRPDGRLVTSLSALAGSGTLPALHRARQAVARLGATDCEVSVDVREAAPDAVFEIVWSPVAAVVDLMLDWDLPELEIALPELAEWLDVRVVVALRALERLARYAGVTVQGPLGDGQAVRVLLDLDACPLTSVWSAAPGSA